MDPLFMSESMPQVSSPSFVMGHCVDATKAVQEVPTVKSEIHALVEKNDDMANALAADDVEKMSISIMEKEMEGVCMEKEMTVDETQSKLDEIVSEINACGEKLEVPNVPKCMGVYDDAYGLQIVATYEEKGGQEDSTLLDVDNEHTVSALVCLKESLGDSENAIDIDHVDALHCNGKDSHTLGKEACIKEGFMVDDMEVIEALGDAHNMDHDDVIGLDGFDKSMELCMVKDMVSKVEGELVLQFPGNDMSLSEERVLPMEIASVDLSIDMKMQERRGYVVLECMIVFYTRRCWGLMSMSVMFLLGCFILCGPLIQKDVNGDVGLGTSC